MKDQELDRLDRLDWDSVASGQLGAVPPLFRTEDELIVYASLIAELKDADFLPGTTIQKSRLRELFGVDVNKYRDEQLVAVAKEVLEAHTKHGFWWKLRHLKQIWRTL